MTASDLRQYDRDGVLAALISASLLGLAPIFGKQALQAGIDYRVLVTRSEERRVGKECRL